MAIMQQIGRTSSNTIRPSAEKVARRGILSWIRSQRTCYAGMVANGRIQRQPADQLSLRQGAWRGPVRQWPNVIKEMPKIWNMDRKQRQYWSNITMVEMKLPCIMMNLFLTAMVPEEQSSVARVIHPSSSKSHMKSSKFQAVTACSFTSINSRKSSPSRR